ncbi:MAG: hypothetical protein CJBNEKGG_04435 [Prosthecobacter sp.]|nr:hypothetical protein [Prosthecobacter sp.]
MSITSKHKRTERTRSSCGAISVFLLIVLLSLTTAACSNRRPVTESAMKWTNLHAGDPSLAGVELCQYPEGAVYESKARYSGKHPAMILYGFRYYSPELGRWLSRDPIEEEGGINLYGMVGNDPVNRVDVKGQIPLDTVWDVGNVVFDIAVGDYASLTADVAALFIPYVPAGTTKIGKAVQLGDKVKDAKLTTVMKIDNAVPGLSRLGVKLGYVGKAGGKYTKHFAKQGENIFQTSKNGPAKFNNGTEDYHVKGYITDALKAIKDPRQLDGFVYTTQFTLGAVNGVCTSRIKLRVNSLGEIHAHPW